MFIPHTDAEREAMLAAVGAQNIEDLFKDVPGQFRFPTLDLPPAMTEMEVLQQAMELSSVNESTRDLICFLGAGAYNHYIPSAVDALLRRGELFTAYTPYQPEVSQGTLQSIFEYQTMVAALTGMDISNASHYDGATAAAEAAVMAYHHFRGKRKKFILSPSVNPQYRATLRTYLSGYIDLKLTGDEAENHVLIQPDELIAQFDPDTAMVMVQYPDFFGRIFDYTKLAAAAHAVGALVVVVVNPTALGLLKPPGEFGADVVVGEGQPLGIPMSFGGPFLGLYATKSEYARKIAGRLVGETVDGDGKRGYVLTLTAREQHIRREKATSNICTNQGLMATASAIYMSLLGKHGLRKLAELCYYKAHYAAVMISQLPGYSLCFDTPFFHEFAICCPAPVEDINHYLLDNGVLGGYDLGQDYPGLENRMLLAVTEMNSRAEIDLLVDLLAEAPHD